MEVFRVEHVNFQYSHRKQRALRDISFHVDTGEFVILAGLSGCGKTTLLKQLKPSLTPFGSRSGSITFQGKTLANVDAHDLASKIGFVMQNPDHQIVTDKVWHELAFGLESLGVSQSNMQVRIGEMATYFGLDGLFHRDTSTLSGGQKQLLNLASIMVMRPDVLLLDEPCAQLDPIGASVFLQTLKQIHEDFGTTIILVEHHLEDALKLADRVIVLEEGTILCDVMKHDLVHALLNVDNRHPMLFALPIAMRVYALRLDPITCPISIGEGKAYLRNYYRSDERDFAKHSQKRESILQVKDVYFRYDAKGEDVVKGLNLTLQKQEILALVGGNGVGKSTTLKMIAKLYKPYRGSIHMDKQAVLAYLPQDPLTLFVKDSLREDIRFFVAQRVKQDPLIEQRALDWINLLQVEHLLDQHPYDLSGGELQVAGLCKILLQNANVLLLDEPTKGLDLAASQRVGNVLKQLQVQGCSILVISHDIEFCANFCDRAAMLFDGRIISIDDVAPFFKKNRYYTTATAKLCENYFPNALVWDDVQAICEAQSE